MGEQLSFFTGLVDPPRLPAGPVPERSLGKALDGHLAAMRDPRPGHERALVGLLRSLAEYAQAHAKSHDAPISECHYLGPEWKQIVSSSHCLLSGELGRLDGGELSRQFYALEAAFGDGLSTKTVLEETAPVQAPRIAASRGRVNKAEKVAEVPIGTKRLTERQRELLSLVRVENNVAVYTGTERIPDWGALKSVMVALGGAWKSGKSGFVFADDLDAVEIVRLAQETGEIIDPKEAEFFETSAELAEALAKWVSPKVGQCILEPSAGRGAIVRALQAECPEIAIVVCEPLEEHKNVLARLGCAHLADDFAAKKSFPFVIDGVAMNPPFSKGQDVRHITKAIDLLRTGGRLAAIASAGVLYRTDRLHQEFRELVALHGGTIIKNPENSFAHAGTGVSTVMVRLQKGGLK